MFHEYPHKKPSKKAKIDKQNKSITTSASKPVKGRASINHTPLQVKSFTPYSAFSPPEKETYRRSGKAESFPKTIGKISFIGFLDSFGTIGKNGKIRGPCPDLGRVIEFYPLRLMKRMMVRGHRLLENPVQVRGRYPF
jgi:hypothetical protein